MLVILATHPIQYQVPLWKKLTEQKVNMEVWYLTDFGTKESYDVQFGKSFAWDIPTLSGYKYRFLKAKADTAPNKGFWAISLQEDIAKLFSENKVTHVYINGWQVLAYWQALWSAKRLGLTTLFKGESNDLKPEVSWKWPFKKLLLSQFLKRVDYFLYIGTANKRLYQKYGVQENKLYPGYYCVENERFLNSSRSFKKDKSKLRQEWNIPENSFCILFSGKFIEKKRPLDIIRAVKSINNSPVHFHVLYVGSGALYENLKEAANVVFDSGKEVNPAKENMVNISFTGFLNQSEIPKAYAVADCLVLPSTYEETWGLVVNEAMASGIPCIVSDQCGCNEDLVRPLNKNLVFRQGDVTELAKSISYLTANPFEEAAILKQVAGFTYNSSINSVKEILTK